MSSQSDLQTLAAFLSDHDESCPACRYNLRGLTNAKCPECGSPLCLGVRAMEPVSRLWLLMTIMCFSAIPFNLWMLPYFLNDPTFGFAQWSVLVSMAALGLLAVPVLLIRRKFSRWSLAVRVPVASVIILLWLWYTGVLIYYLVSMP